MPERIAGKGRRVPKPSWHTDLAKYAQADRRKALFQLANTFIPYIGLWALLILTRRWGLSYWLTLALSAVAAAFLVRIFIFFHDCGHGSFFPSPRANTVVGYVCGVLTFTPYHDWRVAHARHHATAGNLDRRGVGDVWTMTVEEFQSSTRAKRLAYRLFRNPLIIFGLGPAFMFLIAQRFSHKGAKRRERVSVVITNLSILGIALLATPTIGFWTYVSIQLPVIIMAGTMGLWLFYVQHQYEGMYWARDEEWDATRAALEGSSYYKLPKVLQWLTGNIGLHHIHHLRPKIPNYWLQRCFDEVKAMQAVPPLTLLQSLKSLRMNLWDESAQKLVSFRSLARSARAAT